MSLSRIVILIGLLAAAVAPAWAASVQASVDRSTVQLGDTVTLNLRVEGAAGGIAQPDLSALGRDFTLLGSSQNRSLSVANGKTTSSLTIGIALRPNRIGTLTIPALDVGGMRTQPLQLDVVAPNPALAAAGHQDVFMQAQVTPAAGYVGEQFSYVVQLYYAVNIESGSLEEPKADGLDVSKLGDDLNYEANRGGREYHVLERRYALTPSRAGHIEIPATTFQGETSNPMDPNSFFGASTPVAAAAPALAIDVQVAPADWGQSAWLPARAVDLEVSGWPAAGDAVRVGVPFNLTMTLRATGLPATALPALSMPSLDGASAYPDKPQDSTRSAGPWLMGERSQVFAIVPQRAGVLTIPAITVKWWNVLTGQAAMATVPSRQLTVLPGAGGGTAPMPAAPSSAGLPAGATSTSAPLSRRATPTMPWAWIALASLGLWLVTVAGWWFRRRLRRHGDPDPQPSARRTGSASDRSRRLAFLAAARGNDAQAQARTLLAWARGERAGVRTLGDLAARLASADQRAEIQALQVRRFAAGDADGFSNRLAAVFKDGFVWQTAPGSGSPTLPPLYPHELG